MLSAAFIRLFNMPTVSFHMADDYCSIDLDTPTLTKEQVESAEFTLLQRVAPVAGLAIALFATVAWIGLVGYTLIKLF